MITLLSGGTGSPKLLQGMNRLVPQSEVSVIVNTGEDVEVSGLRVSPDLDTVVYTLAGIIDDDNWYGIEGDSFTIHDTLAELGHKEILKIGDKDRAVQLYRTMRMREGVPLSKVTEEICRGLGVSAEVLPMTDDRVTTRVLTEEGEISFHDFWVKRRAEVRVEDVRFEGSSDAEPAPGIRETLNESDSIIIGPSNPITSLGPILSVDGIRSCLEDNREKVIAISPVIGDGPVSGPTGVLMNGLGHDVSPVGVAKIYRDIAGGFVLHEEDGEMKSDLEDMDMEVFLRDILMPDISSRERLASEILEVLGLSHSFV